ncbi:MULTISPECIES: hypothetical protein [Niastella]|uniref:Zinc-ribbon 15 domain-containing protein n=1 Tax=Niastella soli TaxID=2821487 RepID=A0ABS3Z5C4_9BACT|nr:hypothetical protein [Niastella soli]MBO9205243.1 hypothetical protein [Niastella soli]
MIVFSGRKVAKIKEFTDHTQSCTSCKAFDLKVKVFRQYRHIYFIPFLPVGENAVDIRCNVCQAPVLTESLKKEYAKTARAPVYLYSMLILLVLLLTWIGYGINKDGKDSILFVANPKVGDVYIVKDYQKASSVWYFLRAASVAGDTVLVYHSHLQYAGYVNTFNSDDYFVKSEQLYYTKKELKQMLEKGEINGVKRDYGDYEGFNRLK